MNKGGIQHKGSLYPSKPLVQYVSKVCISINGKTRYKRHPESKERLCIQSVHLFCCSQSLVSGVQCDVENCLMLLYVGPCYMVSAEIAVAMGVPIENPIDCEVQGVISFLQADEILGYLAEEASSRVELFCCTSAYCPADTSLAT